MRKEVRQMQKEEKRFRERQHHLDLLRAIACLSVVMIHVSAEFVVRGSAGPDFWVGNLLDSLSRAGVPLFVMISGALMLNKPISYKKLWTQRIFKTAVLLAVFSLISYLCGVAAGKEVFSLKNFVLGAYEYDVITFNNGLHSLTTNREEWIKAYRAAVTFIQDKMKAKLFLVLSTPLTVPEWTAQSAELNQYTLEVAKEKGLLVIDLFTPMDALDRAQNWKDTHHFREDAVAMQGQIISDYVRKALGDRATNVGHAATATGPSGAIE
jgi:hypothetical protein